VDKQQQVEGMSMELEAANSKGSSRQLFQIVKSMTRKFQPRLQCIQSAAGENFTEVHKSQTGEKGLVKTCTMINKGKELNKNIGSKSLQHFALHSEVARAIRYTVSRKATGPHEVRAELFKAGGEKALDKIHRI